MSDNPMPLATHDKNGLDWKELEDGSWNAIAGEYKLAAFKISDEWAEKSAEKFLGFLYRSVLYKWDKKLDLWVLIEKMPMGAKSIQEALLDCEALLGATVAAKDFGGLQRKSPFGNMPGLDASSGIGKMLFDMLNDLNKPDKE